MYATGNVQTTGKHSALLHYVGASLPKPFFSHRNGHLNLTKGYSNYRNVGLNMVWCVVSDVKMDYRYSKMPFLVTSVVVKH